MNIQVYNEYKMDIEQAVQRLQFIKRAVTLSERITYFNLYLYLHNDYLTTQNISNIFIHLRPYY